MERRGEGEGEGERDDRGVSVALRLLLPVALAVRMAEEEALLVGVVALRREGPALLLPLRVPAKSPPPLGEAEEEALVAEDGVPGGRAVAVAAPVPWVLGLAG